MFITFEGLDYSGKTTQAKLLVRKLKQSRRPTSYYREPGSTWLSEKIRETVLDSRHLIELKQTEISFVAEMFLFSAARTQLVKDKILPDLQEGSIVVCDRFYDSTTAYQGYGRGLNPLQVKQANQIAALGLRPNITFFLDISVEKVIDRKVFDDLFHDRIETEAMEFYERVRNGYLEIAKDEPERIVVIEGSSPKEEIHRQIWMRVQELVKESNGAKDAEPTFRRVVKKTIKHG